MSKKNIVAQTLLLSLDLLLISMAILLSVFIRNNILPNIMLFDPVSYIVYLTYPFPYVVIVVLFMWFGLYTRRYDLWQESLFIIKICFISFIIIFATLALGKNIEYYSRAVLLFSLFLSAIFLPLGRYFLKKTLFKLGFWRKKVKFIGNLNDSEFALFNSSHIGYVLSEDDKYDVVFLSSNDKNVAELNELIESNKLLNREILFIPVLNQYDFTQSVLYNNFDTRVNLFTLENKLLGRKSKVLKHLLDYALVLSTLPFWGMLILVVSIKLKLEEPTGKIFFLQKRLGKNGKVFHCYKFRTMVSDQSFMEQWLIDNPEEKTYYSVYHKYINDPRITRLGHFLRRTSLDELPQLFNVLKGDMSLVGNRPYMVEEQQKMKDAASIILMSKPGVTGLWQVSGRSDVSFEERLQIDSWYIKNWSIWNDIVILFKTIGVVLRKDGAS
ncbi:putative sugar transferase [Actinobacillus lignieresii]|uniref:sugar transferase n=1 Tax=Actinobacillus lignieresii TaxID=720 RepID=UPI000F6DC71D|nr:sugar transferase [Actinobacillus lignieresii]VEB26990.1 putative sugar transferase [Actinobacillus lignieresii]